MQYLDNTFYYLEIYYCRKPLIQLVSPFSYPVYYRFSFREQVKFSVNFQSDRFFPHLSEPRFWQLSFNDLFLTDTLNIFCSYRSYSRYLINGMLMDMLERQGLKGKFHQDLIDPMLLYILCIRVYQWILELIYFVQPSVFCLQYMFNQSFNILRVFQGVIRELDILMWNLVISSPSYKGLLACLIHWK